MYRARLVVAAVRRLVVRDSYAPARGRCALAPTARHDPSPPPPPGLRPLSSPRPPDRSAPAVAYRSSWSCLLISSRNTLRPCVGDQLSLGVSWMPAPPFARAAPAPVPTESPAAAPVRWEWLLRTP